MALGTLPGTATQAASPLKGVTFESGPIEFGDVAGDTGRKMLKALGLPTMQWCLPGMRQAHSLERCHVGLPSCSYERSLEPLALAST